MLSFPFLSCLLCVDCSLLTRDDELPEHQAHTTQLVQNYRLRVWGLCSSVIILQPARGASLHFPYPLVHPGDCCRQFRAGAPCTLLSFPGHQPKTRSWCLRSDMTSEGQESMDTHFCCWPSVGKPEVHPTGLSRAPRAGLSPSCCQWNLHRECTLYWLFSPVGLTCLLSCGALWHHFSNSLHPNSLRRTYSGGNLN